MIKKKGFTMIELLAAIVILGILSVTTIVAATKLTEKARKEDERQYEQTLKMAAESYMQANPSELPKVIGETTFVTAKELKEKREEIGITTGEVANDLEKDPILIENLLSFSFLHHSLPFQSYKDDLFLRHQLFYLLICLVDIGTCL